MLYSNINYIVQNFANAKPAMVRLLIAQMKWSATEWIRKDGLYFHKKPEEAFNKIEKILTYARRLTVNMVILPELSVPEHYINAIQEWSVSSGAVVIGGSHYHSSEEGYIARSPIIVGGDVFFTEKIVPAPTEVSPIRGLGLIGGNKITVFKNTSVGDFGVLICSDYLDDNVKINLLNHEIDILCIIAFQRSSETYYQNMNNDCIKSVRGLYIAYSNTLCNNLGDGRSALFAIMDKEYLSRFVENNYTDSNPLWKVCGINQERDHMVVDLDLKNKKPTFPRTVHTRPNVFIVPSRYKVDNQTETFVKKILHDDERYAQIEDLFIEPIEYKEMRKQLDKNKLLFIIGDPGIGKTYTAARLLRLYFDQGYGPIWYTGLEEADRLIQRQTLENIRPKDKQIIYFEDPFGRTTFEKRESLLNIFMPLIDHLKEVDARIIITSRKDIFEQFIQEILTPCELLKFAEEMNIVKPSYSTDALKAILIKLSQNRCKWYEMQELKKLVLKEIDEGRLKTPLAIRDFVFSTEKSESIDIILARIKKRDFETKTAFSQEMLTCNISTRLALSLILLFGKQSQKTLSKWFTIIAHFLEPNKHWSGTSPFLEEVRRQLGYRIEQYGYKGYALRFIHPYYEEGFAEIASRDTITFEVISITVKYIARENIRFTINSILKNTSRYPELTTKLIEQVIPIIKSEPDLDTQSIICLRLLRSFIESIIQNDLHPVQKVFSPKELINKTNELINKINIESSWDKLTNPLRFIHAYQRKFLSYFSGKLDWNCLFPKLRNEANFRSVFQVIERLMDLDPIKTNQLLESIPEKLLITRFQLLDINEQAKVIQWSNSIPIKALLKSAINTEYIELASKKERILKNSPDHIGIIADDGAIEAIKKSNNLLPVGITEVIGDFERSEFVSIFDQRGVRVAAGMSVYDSEDLKLIMGQHSKFIGEILGYKYGNPIIRSHDIAFLI